jgi:1,4-dihydroxy-2-naphthoyl-CoA hydrolase
MSLERHFVIPFERSFDAALGLEYLGGEDGELRGRAPVTPALLGPDGAVHSGIYAAIAESLASTGTALAVLPLGLVPSGLSNSTHVLGTVAAGSLDALARCRSRGELEWLWDVEITGPDGTPGSASAVVIAVRPARR